MIEIQEPELEALIMERLYAGQFENVEQAVMDALKTAPPPKRPNLTDSGRKGSEIITAFQRCPVKEFDFEPERLYSPISDPVKF